MVNPWKREIQWKNANDLKNFHNKLFLYQSDFHPKISACSGGPVTPIRPVSPVRPWQLRLRSLWCNPGRRNLSTLVQRIHIVCCTNNKVPMGLGIAVQNQKRPVLLGNRIQLLNALSKPNSAAFRPAADISAISIRISVMCSGPEWGPRPRGHFAVPGLAQSIPFAKTNVAMV